MSALVLQLEGRAEGIEAGVPFALWLSTLCGCEERTTPAVFWGGGGHRQRRLTRMTGCDPSGPPSV